MDRFNMSPKDLREPLKVTSLLLIVYFGLRTVFFANPEWKIPCFIYPTGQLCALFWGHGDFNGEIWAFRLSDSWITVGELCSGSTFFCLLAAYLVMRCMLFKLPVSWLLLCYPFCILVNAARVITSSYVSIFTHRLIPLQFQEHFHLAIGVVVFFISFLMLVAMLDRMTLEKYFEN